VETRRNTPSILSFVLVMILVVAVIYYLVITINTGDAQWFRSDFEAKAQEIVVHCFGEDVILTPTDVHYSAFTELVNAAISQEKRWDPLSLSEQTYADYQTHPKMMTVELRFMPAVRIHSDKKYFSVVDTLIIPLEGRHAQYNTVFGRNDDNPAAGSFHLESTAALTEYLAAQGICRMP
jgi:hypothetical protein